MRTFRASWICTETFGQIDFLLHSIAFADRDDLSRDTVHTSRDGFKLAMDVSVYTLFCTAAASQS